MLNPRGRSQAYNAMWVEDINNFHIAVVVAAAAAVSKVENLKFCVQASHSCGGVLLRVHNEWRILLLEKRNSEASTHKLSGHVAHCQHSQSSRSYFVWFLSLAYYSFVHVCGEKKKRTKVSKYNSSQIMLYICFISPHTAPWTRICGKAFKAFSARVNGRFVAASKGGK